MSSRNSERADKRQRHRQGSPRRTDEHSHKRQRTQSRGEELQTRLPFDARPLTKHDLGENRALLGLYLDLQKQLYIDDLSEHEIKGRWKSFLGKWNRGELSEGYYDPATKRRADTASSESENWHRDGKPTQVAPPDEDEDDDGYGPSLPQGQDKSASAPTRQDLQYRDELRTEAQNLARQSVRHERKLEQKQQQERMDEIAPRAAAGSRERQLEKKREKSDANRSFRDSKEAGAEEVGDRDLMGDEGIEGYKAQVKEQERRKTEREIRKEEVLRARAAEREERLSAHRAKEAKTLDMLKDIAKQRFG
ncbi:hypothetical protein C1H76_1327 [Elsinoe australis]|uniref:Uncharacterized protein n=1 Tax=Elsinoe australis TaxID=40998 RepID=A0A4U7B911_9PEZI|nr:hypothetical protein C1H76_1327 [Elsinoe australis]